MDTRQVMAKTEPAEHRAPMPDADQLLKLIEQVLDDGKAGVKCQLQVGI